MIIPATRSYNGNGYIHYIIINGKESKDTSRNANCRTPGTLAGLVHIPTGIYACNIMLSCMSGTCHMDMHVDDLRRMAGHAKATYKGGYN